jgi:hypothetical protein
VRLAADAAAAGAESQASPNGDASSRVLMMADTAARTTVASVLLLKVLHDDAVAPVVAVSLFSVGTPSPVAAATRLVTGL